MRKAFTVVKKFGRNKVGDTIYPIGLVRSGMLKKRWIVEKLDAPATAPIEAEIITVVLADEPIAPVHPCDDDDIADDIDEDEDDSPLIETAEAPQPEVAVKRGPGRPRRV